MKINEILCDWLMKTQLFEQAYRKRELEDRIAAQQINIASHMIKILIFPDSDMQQHWRAEVTEWLKSMNRYKLKRGDHLGPERIREILFDQPLGTAEEIMFYVNDMQDEYPHEVAKFDLLQLQKTLAMIMDTVSKDISQRRFTKIEYYL